MEKLDSNLKQRMVTKPELTLLQKISILKDVLNGLITLHAQNLAFLDLKRPNVLLADNGSFISAKLADFGITRFLDNNSKTNVVEGTTAYLSPEHFEVH